MTEEKDPYYKTQTAVQTETGIIDYDPEKMKDIVGGERLSYDEYLEIQKNSAADVRGTFQLCYYNTPLGFKGEIEKRTKDKICFKRIYVEGMYPDGLCFSCKEDHVWMDLIGFENYQEGNSVSFFAEIYRYLKTGNGKKIDFGLRNPAGIKQIEPYELPSDEELIRQELAIIVCDTCPLGEQCTPGMCLLPKGEKKRKENSLYKEYMKSQQK